MEQAIAITELEEKELIEKAQALVAEQNWQEAIFLLEPHRKTNKLLPEGLHLLAYSYSQSKNYDNAINIYESLSPKHPTETRWLYYLAYQYRKKNDFQTAIDVYEKCISLSPYWLKVFLELGKLYEDVRLIDKALDTYQKGIQTYKKLKPEKQKELGVIYSDLCTRAAKLINSTKNMIKADRNEMEYLLKESIAADSQNADAWYRLGNFFLEADKPDEAISYLQKAETLAPKKEYIPHKIAQVYLKKGDTEQALRIYEAIPQYKRTPYILHGMAKCMMKNGKLKEGAFYFYIATQREPDKWYHHRDLGLAFADLGDRDQAISFLVKANQLYKKEKGEDLNRILAKIEELKAKPQGENIVFEKSATRVTTTSDGVVDKYNSERGFGFIKDNNKGERVFFHISKIRNRIEPAPGVRVKFARELGEKGPQASRVWVISRD